MRALLVFALLLIPALAGCTSDDTLRIAFVAKDTATAPHEDLDRLAEFIEHETGRPTKVLFFTSSTAALEAVRFGQADVASVDGAAAWLAWNQNGLEAIASEVRGDGRTYYRAAAWVHADSDIQSIDDFAGRTSCHTGAMKSAGMFLPISYLVQAGLIDASAYPDDISQVPEMAKDFFDNPVIGGAYEGYNGALRCLSDNAGEIAFIRDTTPADYCTQGDAETWCLPIDQYRKVVEFGNVPEHPFMVSPDLDASTRADLLAALLALNDSDNGQAILTNTFGTGSLQAVDTEAHLGGYGALIAQLPGMAAYAESQ